MLETPDWHSQPAPCPHGDHNWHAEPRGTCETSCLAPIVIVPTTNPLRWEGDDA